MPESASPAAPQSPPTPASAGPSRSAAPPRRLTALRRRAGELDLALLGTALLLALLSWPIADLEAQAGLDPSWRTALQMSVHDGLQFGREVVFTYGPLGFLREPQLAFAWLTRLSFAYVMVLQSAFCLTLLWVLRRNFGSLLIAAPIAFVIAELSVEEPVPTLAFAVAVALVRGELRQRIAPGALAALGALAGVQVLGKLNVGITVLALCAIALLALPDGRRRAAVWIGAGLAAALLAGWTLTGQPAAAAWDYVRASLQTIAGYSQAMAVEDPGKSWELWAALALSAIGLAVAVRGETASPGRTRLALAALWAVLAFTSFKSGFVRNDAGHASIFFAAILGGLAALPLARLPRTITALVLLGALAALFGARDRGPGDLIAPWRQARAFVHQARVLADPSTTNAHIVAARERLAGTYQLDAASFAKLAGHTVHVDPYETNVAFAYRLRWKPLPVFQTYIAYTPDLDERNARALRSPGGPERVLRHAVGGVDGRNTAWESPAAMRAMLCHFRAVSTTASWQVLARAPDRCGAQQPLGETRARFGESVPIPRAPGPRSAVYVALEGAGVEGGEKLVNLLYRAQQRYVTLDGTRSFRLVPATATDGLLLRVPRADDFPPPFHLDQGARRLTVTRGSGDQSSGEIRLRWYATTLR